MIGEISEIEIVVGACLDLRSRDLCENLRCGDGGCFS